MEQQQRGADQCYPSKGPSRGTALGCMSSNSRGEPASCWFLLAHHSVAETVKSLAILHASQPQNPYFHMQHTCLYGKNHIWDYACIHTLARLHSLPHTYTWNRGKQRMTIPRQRGREAGVMPLPLMQCTSSPDPSISDLLQELIKISLKNNCKMKQIALSGGQ